MSVYDTTVEWFIRSEPYNAAGGRHEAVFNNAAHSNFVGYLDDFQSSTEIRKSSDPKADADGGVFGSFRRSERVLTLEVVLKRAATFALSNARLGKLLASSEALAADGELVWAPSGLARVGGGPETLLVPFRTETDPRGPDKDAKVLLTLASENSLFLGNPWESSAPGTGLTNAGLHATFPHIECTCNASGTLVISRTFPTPTESLTLTIGGAAGLTPSTATIVDFADRTVLQLISGVYVDRRSAVQWPGSIWWAMPPGASNVSVTGASTGAGTVKWRNAWIG